jgi:hypothetical protein
MPADGRVTIATPDGRTREVGLEDYLDADTIEVSEREANAWIKRLRHAVVGAGALRDRFTYRGDSLWWFIELYLHKQRTVVSAHRLVRALEAVVARERPLRLSAGAGALLGLLTPQVASRHGIEASEPGTRWPLPAARGRLLVRSHFHILAAIADRVRPMPHAPRGAGVQVAAFVHSAFWRRDQDEEGYVGPVLRALGERLPSGAIALVGLGPRTNFRARRWRHRLAEFNDPAARALPLVPIESLAGWRAIRPSLVVWRDRRRALRAMAGSDDVRRAAIIDGYDIWPALQDDLLGVSHLQMPWSARSMDEAASALDALKPRVIVTYAEAGGWGRALALEARRRGIPLVGLQHGFIYRHWLNYLHEPDEMAPSPRNAADCGFPRPDLTLVYDGFAQRHLIEAGRFPPETVAVTGSPRLEAFAESGRRLAAADRERIRADAGARPKQKLIVLATKFSQIRGWFEPLVDALRAMPDVHLAVKCHPAESGEPYRTAAHGATNVRVLPAAVDLGRLVACADLIVTVNSTAAIEAMAVHVPGLVLGLPNNLSPFVEAGALAGVERPAEIAAILRRLLYDEMERHNLGERRGAFVARYGMVSEGGAAERAAEAILQFAHSPVAGRPA